MVESLVIEVPVELVEGLDDIVMLMGFRSREEFALVALRQLLDKHMALMKCIRSDD
ncbi:MAG: ribbon-helix-helix domain-containing protein [Candidatus Bathyarchaeota archaeon]|nr:ribbon-helix-helix domain-containing protein [Candidatus Bathyarchaeota archaeon]